jgi:pimeloyl-CoA synthetase
MKGLVQSLLNKKKYKKQFDFIKMKLKKIKVNNIGDKDN